LQTNNDLEIDIIIERPGLPSAFVEIKSTEKVSSSDLSSLNSIKKDYPKNQFYCLSNDPIDRKDNGVEILHWKNGLKELGF
jgi:hypothetical protein